MRCPVCRKPIEKYQVVYFDHNNIYHVPCTENHAIMMGIGWHNGDVLELHPFPPLE
jgi:hypothetical protein